MFILSNSKFLKTQAIYTSVPRGQLGNHLQAYSALVSLKEFYNSKKDLFFLCTETWEYLTTYFKPSKLLLPSLNKMCICKSHKGIYSKPWKWSYWTAPKDKDFIQVGIFNKTFGTLNLSLYFIYILGQDYLLEAPSWLDNIIVLISTSTIYCHNCLKI